MSTNNVRPQYLFLDCEWADVMAKDLVSIGIASMDGEQTFYAEVDPLPVDPTPWVRAVVYQLLQRDESAMTIPVMSLHLRTFFATFEKPLICYDYIADRQLCERLLHEQSVRSDLIHQKRPEWQLLDDVGPALKRWWVQHPEVRSKRHHALVDAFALRAAYLSLWGI